MKIAGGLVALAFITAAAMMIARFSQSSYQALGSMMPRLEVGAMKRSITENISCRFSLDSPDFADLPLNCSDFTDVEIKDLWNEDMAFAGWTAKASCVDDELVFKIEPEPGAIDPLSNQPWELDSSLLGKVFEGHEYCSDYFNVDKTSITSPGPGVPPPKYYGGNFDIRIRWVETPAPGNPEQGECRPPGNRYNNGLCSCPGGFFPFQILDFLTGATEETCRRWYTDGITTPDWQERCGIAKFLCLPITK